MYSCFSGLAVAFSLRGSSALAITALRRWHQVYSTHQNAQAFAAHYHSSQLRYKMLLVWRLQLRTKLKQVKLAKTMEKFFVTRSAWQGLTSARLPRCAMLGTRLPTSDTKRSNRIEILSTQVVISSRRLRSVLAQHLHSES